MLMIDSMTGLEFESFVSTLFLYLDYDVCKTAFTQDYGADLIVSKDDENYCVQTKRYKHNVSVNAIYEVLGSCNYYNIKDSIVVTNSYFTKNAIVLAKTSNVKLIDRDTLINIIESLLSKNYSFFKLMQQLCY